jgi:hypothetical protein
MMTRVSARAPQLFDALRTAFKVLTGLLLVGVVLLGVFALSFKRLNTPPDEKYLLAFHRHRADHERLRVLFLADTGIGEVHVRTGLRTTASWVRRMPEEIQFPPARYREYVRLLRQTGAVLAYRSHRTDPRICIMVWSAGWAGHTLHISVCSLARRPDLLVASVDEANRGDTRAARYRHIDGDWYFCVE